MVKFAVHGENKLKQRWNNPQTAGNYFHDRFIHPVWSYMHLKESRVVNTLFSQIKPDKILDMATGPARVSQEMKHFKEGWAVDYSSEMLKIAQKKLIKNNSKWKVQKEDAFSLSFNLDFFDALTSFRFLRHFNQKDRKRILGNVKRVLKPGGYFIFEALNKNMDPYLFHPQFTGAADKSLYDELYSRDKIKKELEENGFSLIQLTPNINHGKIYFFLAKILAKQSSLLFFIFDILERIDCNRCFQWEVVARKN